MKKYLFILFLACSTALQAQSIQDTYKYVIVPEKFSFLKEPNQYNLNVLLKALFEDKGFKVYFDNAQLPAEIANDKCKTLTADVLEKNTMFVTNLTIVLKDCKGNVLLKSKEGKSREKEYKSSYNAAMRDAFTSFEDFRYAAGAVTETAAVPASTKPENKAPVSAPLPVVPATPSVQTAVQTEGLLYAQPIANGFQLIDAAPKIVMTLLKSSLEECFIATKGSVNGVVLKKNGNWFFEYYKDNALISEKLAIKF